MDKIDEVISRGVENVIPNKEKLEKLLRSGKRLNVYLGVDPTATRIHLGHAVQLRKLQALAALGHNATFLIGDFTALIGDTSDKNTERPVLTSEQIRENFRTYKKQAEKVANLSKIKVRFNSEWLKKLNFTGIVKLCQMFSVGDFVSRELIKKRLKAGKRVGLHETLYPVMQGYDSYFMDTDIQTGGTDQTFNMQAGRTLQKHLRNKESYVIANGFLMGTDGRKMSKSEGNAIWLTDTPTDMYGKIMSIPDDQIIHFFTLATTISIDEVEEKKKQLEEGENPMKLKHDLAYQIVKEIHGERAGQEAREHFEKTFQDKAPEYKTEVSGRENLVDTIESVAGSKSEAKRLISQNAVDINGKTITGPGHEVKSGDEIKVGKRTFVKVK